jgi:peptidoglycan biosynthesis protein MviN/MurJ (putative lipid II flippase)
MLFLLFTIAIFASIQGAICGTIGYVWKQSRWVYGPWDYLRNLLWMALQVACAVGAVWLYTFFFGWPEPD